MISFAIDLEMLFGKTSSEKKASICLLVVNGGRGAIETVREALLLNTPVVLANKTGRAADLLTFVYQNQTEY